MKPVRLIIAAAVVLATGGVYLWWCHPVRVDMAGYVPADSLLYIESNNLEQILSGITHTNTWETLASAGPSRPKVQSATWLSRIALWTGIGRAEEVILARSQFALVVLALETTDAEPTLLIRPAAALVMETHTSERRMRPAIEKRVARLAHQIYPESTSQRKTIDGISLSEWASPRDGRRIVLAFFNSEVILGNDERAVLACVAVRRGSKSLLDNQELGLMRGRLLDDNVAAFGYISAAGIGKLMAAVAPLYIEGMATSPQSQRVLAGAASKAFQSAGWALRFHDGIVEDRYFLALPPDLGRVLSDAFAAKAEPSKDATGFLPSATYSFTQYNLRSPISAWRGLNTALSSRLDILGAVLVTPVLRGALAPYGIEDPEAFLNAVGPEIMTARVDENEPNSVLMAPVLDELALRKLVSQRLGARIETEGVSSYSMLTSSKTEMLAASFADQYLLMGPPPLVRRCLLARSMGATVSSQTGFKRTGQLPVLLPPVAVTYSADAVSAKVLFAVISGSPMESIKDPRDPKDIPFAISTTAVTNDGIEKITRSSSGLIGVLAAHFASGLSGNDGNQP